MRILIVGSDGQLGRELVLQGREKALDIIAAGDRELDITDPLQVTETIASHQPSLVVNAAAYTDVDGAESKAHLAYGVNRDGPANLAAACADAAIPMIQISTDYVFNGTRTSPYAETDPVSPVGVYARSKAEGENQVRSYLSQHIILRTSWLYGVYGYNFVKTMLGLGKEKKVIQVVADQFGSPTSAQDLSAAILAMASHIRRESEFQWGTYHYSGKGVTSWHQFAVRIFALADRYNLFAAPEVKPIPTSEYPTPAKRPAYAALNCAKIQKHFGIDTRPWQESLEITIARMMHHVEDS